LTCPVDDFVRTVEATKVPPGAMITVSLRGEPVVIAHTGDNYYGIGAICNHANWDLSEGALDGTTITCAGHGSRWDLRTGKADFEEPLEDEPLFEVREEGGFLYLRKRGLREVSKS
jgi:3-phenylpropionate/trans-cinnamate dioxygenase ferredoxin component